MAGKGKDSDPFTAFFRIASIYWQPFSSEGYFVISFFPLRNRERDRERERTGLNRGVERG